MPRNTSRPYTLYMLMALVVFQGLSGIFGGIGLVVDPTGATLQIPLEWLSGSPFPDYLVPGIVLLLVLGIYPLAVFYGLFKRNQLAWYGSLLLGIALMIWLGVEIIVIGYKPDPPLQAVYGTVGILILVCTMLPAVKGHLLL